MSKPGIALINRGFVSLMDANVNIRAHATHNVSHLHVFRIALQQHLGSSPFKLCTSAGSIPNHLRCVRSSNESGEDC